MKYCVMRPGPIQLGVPIFIVSIAQATQRHAEPSNCPNYMGWPWPSWLSGAGHGGLLVQLTGEVSAFHAEGGAQGAVLRHLPTCSCPPSVLVPPTLVDFPQTIHVCACSAAL